MTIGTNVSIKAEFRQCWLTVAKMREIIDQIEDDDLLFLNRVGNLSVLRDITRLGYIDFRTEKFEGGMEYSEEIRP